MLRMKVCLGAMRAWKFSVSILDGNYSVLSSASTGRRGSRPPGSTGENTTTALRPHNVGRRVTLLKNRVRLHQRARSIGRRHARLGHDTSGRHRAQDRRTTATDRSRGNGLRVRSGGSGLGHHASRSPVVGWVWVLTHRVQTALAARLGSLLVTRQIVVRTRGVWCSWGSRSVRVASVQRLHGGGGRLQRRERLRKRRARLKLVGGDCGRRRISLTR